MMVARHLRLNQVSLREAAAGDCERVYGYNAAPEVRALSRDPRPIAYADHCAWYAARSLPGALPMWIVEDDGEPVGVIRIQRDGAGRALLSIALGAAARGRGIGRKAIRLATDAWGAPLHAEVLPSNAASLACFRSCGFAEHATAELVTFSCTVEDR